MQNSGLILECLFSLLNSETPPALHHPRPFYAYNIDENCPEVKAYWGASSYQDLIASVQEDLKNLTPATPLPRSHLEDQPAGKLILNALGAPALRLEKSLKTNAQNSYGHLDEVHRASIETVIKSASWIWAHVADWVIPPLKPIMSEGSFFGHITRKDYSAALRHASTETNKSFFSAYLHHFLWLKAKEKNMPQTLITHLKQERLSFVESLEIWQERCAHLITFMNNNHYIAELADVEKELLQRAVEATDLIESQSEKQKKLVKIYEENTISSRDADLLRQEFLASSHNFLGKTRHPPLFMQVIEGCGNKLNAVFDYLRFFQETRSFDTCCTNIQESYETAFSKHRYIPLKIPLDNAQFFNIYIDLIKNDSFFKARLLLLRHEHASIVDMSKQLQRVQHYKALVQALISLSNYCFQENLKITEELLGLWEEDSDETVHFMLLLEKFFDHEGIIRETHLAHKNLKESFLKQIKNQHLGKKSLQDRAAESLKRKTARYFVEGHAMDSALSWSAQSSRVEDALESWRKMLLGNQLHLKHPAPEELKKPLLSLSRFAHPYKDIHEVSEAIKRTVKNFTISDESFLGQITIILNNVELSQFNKKLETQRLLKDFHDVFNRFLKIQSCFISLDSRLSSLPADMVKDSDLQQLPCHIKTCSATLQKLKASIRKETRTVKNKAEGVTAVRILNSGIRKMDRVIKGSYPINNDSLFSEIQDVLKEEYNKLYAHYVSLNKKYSKQVAAPSTPINMTIIENYTARSEQ